MSYLENFVNEYLALIIFFFFFWVKYFLGLIELNFYLLNVLGVLLSTEKMQNLPFFFLTKTKKQKTKIILQYHDIFIQFWGPFTYIIGGLKTFKNNLQVGS